MTTRVTSTAPMPTLGQLCAMLGRADAPDPAAAWRAPGDEGATPFWFSRAAWALTAIVSAHGPRLFLPDYFCDRVTAPARQAGAKIVFYPVNEALTPDWGAVRALHKADRCDVFVLVHYFGFPTATGEARAFCDKTGAALVEDAAHALAPGTGIGGAGDYVFYSLYKHLPLPDGALLLARTRPLAKPDAVARAATALGAAAPGSRGWIARRLVQRIAPALAGWLRQSGGLPFDEDPPAHDIPATPAMSDAARVITASLSSRLAEVTTARRRNEAALRAAFAHDVRLRPLFPDPAVGVTPYRAVFRARCHKDAVAVYETIRRAGSVAESWPDLPAEVRAAPSRHTAALALRNSVIALPVHADRDAAGLVQAYAAPWGAAA